MQSKDAIVIEGASGLGYASAKRFVEEGALVVIADIQNELGIQVAEELGESSQICLSANCFGDYYTRKD